MEGVVPAGGSIGCATERCYGRKIIGWGDQLGACAKGVKIGVIDTGYDAAHPAFEKLALKPKVVMEDQSSRAPNWHGTGVLSLLAAAATSSTPGLVPEAQFLVADAFFKNSFGSGPDRYGACAGGAAALGGAWRPDHQHEPGGPERRAGPRAHRRHERPQGRGVRCRRRQWWPGCAARLSRRLQGSHSGNGRRRQKAELRLRQSRPLHRRGCSGGADLDGAAGQQGGHAERDVLRGAVRDGNRRRHLQQHAFAGSAARWAPAARPQGRHAGGVCDRKARHWRAQRSVWPWVGESAFSCGPAVAPPVAGVTKPPPPAAAAPTQSWQGDITRAAYQ